MLIGGREVTFMLKNDQRVFTADTGEVQQAIIIKPGDHVQLQTYKHVGDASLKTVGGLKMIK